MNRKEIIAKSISIIGVSYPNYFKDFDKLKFELLIETWTEGLEEYENIEWLIKATKKAIAKSEFPPTLKTVIDEFKKLYYDSDKNCSEIWQEMMDYLSSYNHYGEQPVISPITKKIIEKLGGSYNLRFLEQKQLFYLRNQFDKVFEDEVDKQVKNRILGIEEQISQKQIFLIDIDNKKKSNPVQHIETQKGFEILKQAIQNK